MWDEIDWASYAQPWGHPANTVPTLLARLAAMDRSKSGRDFGSALLFAIGNDHGGSFYPIAVPFVRCLAEVLRAGSNAARAEALAVLDDLLSCFDLDTTVVTNATDQQDVWNELRDAAASLRPLVEGMATGAVGDEVVHQLAGEVLPLLYLKGPRPSTCIG